jgi:hypothetical protein
MQGKTKNKQKVLPSEEIAGSLYMEHRTGVVLRPQAFIWGLWTSIFSLYKEGHQAS